MANAMGDPVMFFELERIIFTDDYAGVVYFVYRSRAASEVIREL